MKKKKSKKLGRKALKRTKGGVKYFKGTVGSSPKAHAGPDTYLKLEADL